MAAKKRAAKKKASKKRAKKKAAKKKASRKKKPPRPKDELPHPELPGNHPKNIPGMVSGMFQPGVSGNPAGRPPRKTLEAIIAEELDNDILLDGKPIEARRALARVILDESLSRRSGQILKALMDREYPVPHKHDVNLRGPVQVVLDQQDLEEATDVEPGAGDDLSDLLEAEGVDPDEQ